MHSLFVFRLRTLWIIRVLFSPYLIYVKPEFIYNSMIRDSRAPSSTLFQRELFCRLEYLFLVSCLSKFLCRILKERWFLNLYRSALRKQFCPHTDGIGIYAVLYHKLSHTAFGNHIVSFTPIQYCFVEIVAIVLNFCCGLRLSVRFLYRLPSRRGSLYEHNRRSCSLRRSS